MRALLIVPLGVLVAAAFACGGDDNPPSGFPTGTPPPPPPDSTPTATEGPELRYTESTLFIRPDFTDPDDPAIRWEDTDGEVRYEIAGEVTWWPNCEAGDALKPKKISFDDDVPADTTRFSLPQPDDKRLSILKDFNIDLLAIRETGTFAQDGIGYIGELVCPQDE